jgi:hypothetical protein
MDLQKRPKLVYHHGQADRSTPCPIMEHEVRLASPLTAPSSHCAMDWARACPALPWPEHRPRPSPLHPSFTFRSLPPPPFDGPFGARRGAGGLAHRRRVEVREVAPAAAASWCGRLRPPPLTPRRGAGGHTRRRRVEVWEAAPAAANAPVKVREAAPAAAALRCGRRHPPPPRLHGRKAKLTSRHG